MSSLSDRQENIISILPIPAALLSICGSASIIKVALRARKSKKWTPYTRLMIAISSCDIIYSITMSLSGFLLPKETSPRVWAIGSDATCTTLGFFSQFLVSVLSYNGMLSFYFLLSARLGLKNDEIARKYEPLMHLISLGYPLITGFYGVYAEVFSENELGQGCWVNCKEGDESCNSVLLGWIFGGGITVLSFISIIGNNLVILFYVRGQTIMKRNQREEDNPREDDNNGRYLSSIASIEEGSNRERSLEEGRQQPVQQDSKPFDTEALSEPEEDLPPQELHQDTSVQNDQLKRLKLVASQAFLYVMAFGLTTTWTALLQGIQSVTQGSEIDAQQLEKQLYPILVLQCLFLPLQGVFNFLVYVRPKYLKSKRDFPHLSRSAILRHIVYGTRFPPNGGNNPDAGNHIAKQKVQGIHSKPKGDFSNAKAAQSPPTHGSGAVATKPKNHKWEDGNADAPPVPIPHRLFNIPVSSLTASKDDFDDSTAENNKWGGKIPDAPLPPIAHRLMNFPLSSVSASIGDFDDSTAENNKWDEGSPDAPLPPIAHRVMNLPLSSVSASIGDFDGSAAENNKWDKGSSDTPLSINRPAEHSEDEYSITENKEEKGGDVSYMTPLAETYTSPHAYCFPRVSSLEMISELTTSSEIEMGNGIVRNDPHDTSLDDISVPSERSHHAPNSGGSSSDGGSNRDPLKEGSIRWSASVSSRDLPINNAVLLSHHDVAVQHSVIAPEDLDQMTVATSRGSDKSTGTDGPISVPKRRMSPPPVPQRIVT